MGETNAEGEKRAGGGDSGGSARKVRRLLAVLEGKKSLLIVLQDFPDPDALAAAAALKYIAGTREMTSSVACSGFVGRSENRALVRYLGINLLSVEKLELADYELIALMDTQPGTGNNPLPDGVIPQVVIDHHPIRKETRRAAFFDIRGRYGATSTILYEYLRELGLVPDTQLATALVYGIRSDTNDLGRETSQADVEAFLALYPASNKRKLGKIETARLPRGYFAIMSTALRNAMTYGKCVLTDLGRIDNPDMIGEMADLLLRNEESTWALCYGVYEDELLISVRTSEPGANAGRVVRHVVGRAGTGGGHSVMAGAQVPLKQPTPAGVRKAQRRIVERFLKAMRETPGEGVHLVASPGRKKVHHTPDESAPPSAGGGAAAQANAAS